jgi:hypothetical protein
MPGRIGGGTAPVADKDVARTFAESDLSLIHDGTVVSGESVGLSDSGPSESLNSDADFSGNSEVGITITPSVDLSGITITATDYSGAQTFDSGVRIERLSDNTVVDSDTAAIDPGETRTLTGATLSSGTEYAVYLKDPGTKDSGYDSSVDLPVSNDEFEVTRGWYDSGTKANHTAIDFIESENTQTSGSVYVEWPNPADVFGWDVATFTDTKDGETVEVYVEEAQGSPDWTEVAGPISRGDSIPADPANNVRFRADLSRSSTANNPTLDSLARR